MADLVRYSDKDLKEFKDLIEGKLVEAQLDLDLLRGQLDHSDDHGTDDTGRSFNMMEDGSETMSREEMAQLAVRQEKFIQALKNALIRIENKTYGICRETGKLIQKQRLMLVPHATLSIEAKRAQG
jgi:DnaK suppressor protein